MLAGMDRVVTLRHLAGNLQQSQTHHLEALVLEPRQDLADQPALDAVGLDQDQGALHAIRLSC